MQRKITLSLLALSLLSHGLSAEEKLDDIVVTTTQLPQKRSMSTSIIDVIDADEIREKGYQTLGEALSHQSGIDVTTNGGFGKVTSLFLRGMGTDRILVLLDGVPLNSPTSTDGQAFLEHITLDNVERIEILKGGGSAIWGSDASAGVINIITKNANKQGFHGSVGFSAASYDTQKGTLSLSYANDRYGALLNLSRYKSAGYSAKAPATAEADGYDNTSATGKLFFNITKTQRLSLSYTHIKAFSEYDGSFSTKGADDDTAHVDMRQDDYALAYDIRYGAWTHQLKFAHSRNKRADFSTSAYGDALINYKGTVNAFSLLSRYSYSAGVLSFGAQKEKIEGFQQFNSFTPLEKKFDNKALFALWQHRFNGILGGETQIEASLRRDFFDTFDDATSYKLGFLHRHGAIKGLESFANLYRNTKAPNAYQFANALSGTTLHPDTTDGFDVGLRYGGFSIDYFQNRIRDPLRYDFNHYGYINADGKEKTAGIEASYKQSFGSSFISANYTLLTRYEAPDGSDLPKRAKSLLDLDLGHYFDSGAMLDLQMHYVGDRKEKGHQTGKYTLFDLHYTHHVDTFFDVGVHLKNLFDKAYQTTYGYATPGRTVLIDFRKEF